MSITLEMTQACYEAAKLIYPNKNEITTKAKAIENELGMNFNSAKDYISIFLFNDGWWTSPPCNERRSF